MQYGTEGDIGPKSPGLALLNGHRHSDPWSDFCVEPCITAMAQRTSEMFPLGRSRGTGELFESTNQTRERKDPHGPLLCGKWILLNGPAGGGGSSKATPTHCHLGPTSESPLEENRVQKDS